jgi:hypothetical protein
MFSVLRKINIDTFPSSMSGNLLITASSYSPMLERNGPMVMNMLHVPSSKKRDGLFHRAEPDLNLIALDNASTAVVTFGLVGRL